MGQGRPLAAEPRGDGRAARRQRLGAVAAVHEHALAEDVALAEALDAAADDERPAALVDEGPREGRRLGRVGVAERRREEDRRRGRRRVAWAAKE